MLRRRVRGEKRMMRMDDRGLWKWRGGGKRGKAKAAFPLFPPPLGNLANSARFPHSHSPASRRRSTHNLKPDTENDDCARHRDGCPSHQPLVDTSALFNLTRSDAHPEFL